ncbi:crossover junction endonuclease EME1 [Zerene cesonia]|uniref:crossover junction endonuclease EME1 n=1 Tax=Zerene cesonia TaxID=33412 RepID=UPI0018E5596C|nr:crossover junction endonuclease EME1 [Zerene cesonia]
MSKNYLQNNTFHIDDMSAVSIDLSCDSDDLDDLPELNLVTKSQSQSGSSQSTTSISQNLGTSDKETKQPRKGVKRKASDNQSPKQAQKIYKPGECMKHMILEMHPNLLEAWYCADVSREITASGAKVRSSTAMCDVRLVLWSRVVESKLASKEGVVGLTTTKEPCNHGLYVTRLEDIEEHIVGKTLSQHMLSAAGLAGCKLTLVLFAVKDFFKNTGRKTNNSKKKTIEPIHLEMALTDLLVTAICDTITVNSPNELALTFVQFTKAIAEAPYKKAKRAYDEQVDFYMRGDNKKCAAVSKQGDGVEALWQQMVAVLPMSSLETARAICKQYKTPRALYEAQKQASSVNTLADVCVPRSAVPGSKARRVGSEFARKLHILFTADDGNMLVE